MRILAWLLAVLSLCFGSLLATRGDKGTIPNRVNSNSPQSKTEFPVKPEIFISSLTRSEGITFNGEGVMFVGGDKAIWVAEPNGGIRKITTLDQPLGLAGIGRRDVLAADFGPTNVFQHGPNDDGKIWRITPQGKKTMVAGGIADPNFILVLPDRTFLVSDDGTDKIYMVKGGTTSLWSQAVPYPNGMVLSLDNRTLYVAQIFKSIKPFVGDDRIWGFELAKGSATGPPRLAGRTGEGGVDGLAADELGRIYIADNGAGKIQRLDPKTGEVVLIADQTPGVASLAFGEGKFDREAIYATSTRQGTVWKVRVGVKGARLHR